MNHVIHPQADRPLSWHAVAWSAAFIVYLAVLRLLGPGNAAGLNAFVWVLSAMAAALSCRATARTLALTAAQRRAWYTIALACSSWLVGHLLWRYSDLQGGVHFDVVTPHFFSASKLFYFAYAALMVLGLSRLSDSEGPHTFTWQHVGNLGLIVCCLAVVLVITFLEPVAGLQNAPIGAAEALIHAGLFATTFFAALYFLWTRRWHATWVPMLAIVVATGVFTIGNFIYVYSLLVGSYQPDGWVNATWVTMFLLIGFAAAARRSAVGPATVPSQAQELIARRSRLMEATVPALLMVIMVAVGAFAGAPFTPRVLTISGAIVLLFALILGAREAWIQGESQRLTLELRATNERLRNANSDLKDSEARVRDLNVHLEERVVERTQQLQSAYEELEGFAYAVAHDLKAPLRAIDGFSHLLHESLREQADETTTGFLHRIRRSAVKMGSLIDDLLAYSRIERRALVPQQIDLRDLVDQLLIECAHELQGVELEVHVPSLALHADAEGCSLVLRNLLQNAVKFSRAASPARIEIAARREADHIVLSVRDNGIGFDMQYHEQIFKLFHRLHRDDEYQGTGIGLALVRKALERMQGRVYAQSEAGRGATFTIELQADAPR